MDYHYIDLKYKVHGNIKNCMDHYIANGGVSWSDHLGGKLKAYLLTLNPYMVCNISMLHSEYITRCVYIQVRWTEVYRNIVLNMAIKPKCSSTDEQTPDIWNKDQFVKSNINQKQTVRKCYIQCIFFHLSMKSIWLSVLLSNVFPEGKMSPVYLCSCWSHGHNVCDTDQSQIGDLLDASISVDVMNIH